MTARYMIYLPADAPGRLIRCDDGVRDHLRGVWD